MKAKAFILSLYSTNMCYWINEIKVWWYRHCKQNSYCLHRLTCSCNQLPNSWFSQNLSSPFWNVLTLLYLNWSQKLVSCYIYLLILNRDIVKSRVVQLQIVSSCYIILMEFYLQCNVFEISVCYNFIDYNDGPYIRLSRSVGNSSLRSLCCYN